MGTISCMVKPQTNYISFKRSPCTPSKSSLPKIIKHQVVCKQNSLNMDVAAGVLAMTLGLGMLDSAAFAADLSGLTPCSESKAFDKQKRKEVKALQKRQKLYETESAPYLALQATIDRTESRFANYAKSGLLCGADGLPHLISDPGMALKYGHAGEVFIPTIGFLYVAGYIGSVGRNYIQAVKNEKKPTEKEIIIDVPLALKLSAQGFAWPIQAIKEIRSGTLTEKEDNITVSPR